MMIEVRTKDFMRLLKKVSFSELERRHISEGMGRTRCEISHGIQQSIVKELDMEI